MKPDCSQHPKEIFGESDMKKVAEAIGDLHYDSLYGVFHYLSEKIHNDAKKDRMAGRIKLSAILYGVASLIGDASEEISQAYDICRPFMDNQPSNT